MRTRFRFDHSWVVDAGADAVLALLEDVPGYGAWWPSVRVIGGRAVPGDREARMVVRAPLGYRIRITIAEASRGPGELRAAIAGDLEGWCAWRVRPAGDGTRVDFTQEVDVRAPLLRAASALLHAPLARQHAAVMREAATGMQRRCERR
ncbi:SRPBCC family protein [Agrococcus beijingensis]|uniref:SRPBCC family protein n=1 Tax=Agrococcus beijingensis TaxID=3068634 RepID=UPI002742457C|nr:SRPBCC family protein [Agrococcus sp. REN33]